MFKVFYRRWTYLLFLYFRFVHGVLYLGLSLSAGEFGGSIYLNFVLTSLVEFPSHVLAIDCCNRWARRCLLPLIPLLGVKFLNCSNSRKLLLFGDCSSCYCFGAKEHCFGFRLSYCPLKGYQTIHVRNYESCYLSLPDTTWPCLGVSSKLAHLERRCTCMIFLVSSPFPCHLWCSQMRCNCGSTILLFGSWKKSGPILGSPPSCSLFYRHPSLLNLNSNNTPGIFPKYARGIIWI